MSTSLQDVQNQIQTRWSPIFMRRLEELTPLRTLALYNTQYRVGAGSQYERVSQVDSDGTAQTRSVGVDSNSFNTNDIKMNHVDLKIEKRFVDGYKWDDEVPMLSIVDPNSFIIDQMARRIGRSINDYLYSKVAPDVDLVFTSVASLDAAQLLAGRTAGSKKYWDMTRRRFCLASPDYYADVLADEKNINLDYGPTDAYSTGIVGKDAYGWTIIEDNSLTGFYALGLDLDWLLYDEKGPIRFRMSDGHSNDEFTIKMTADLHAGAVLSVQGSSLHMTWSN